MKVKALKSFSGAVTMCSGQEREISDEFILKDLLKAGYVEAIENGDNDSDKQGDSDGQGTVDEPKKEEKPKKKSKKGSDAE